MLCRLRHSILRDRITSAQIWENRLKERFYGNRSGAGD